MVHTAPTILPGSTRNPRDPYGGGVMSRALLTRKAVEIAGAITAGIGLWRFTSGDWISGIRLTLGGGGLIPPYVPRLPVPARKPRYLPAASFAPGRLP